MQHQLIGIDAFGGSGLSCSRLEWRLARLGVVETDLEEDPSPEHRSHASFRYGEDYADDDYDGVD
jgi:hypothetical protein